MHLGRFILPSVPSTLIASIIEGAMSSNSIYSFSAKTTSISYPWPADITGIERIALSAKGDLQRVLSAFFDRSISIATVYADTYHHLSSDSPAVPLSLPPDSAAIAAASPDLPIVQKRQVHLQCSGRVVCTATSQVRITSPRCAYLNLVEKYAIGQTFAQMQMAPSFELVSVGLGPVNGLPLDMTPSSDVPLDKQRQQLWRRYTLAIPGFECDILEVFPSRDMFVYGTNWLDNKLMDNRLLDDKLTDIKQSDKVTYSPSLKVTYVPHVTTPRTQTSLILFLGLGFLLVIALEISMYFTRNSLRC